MLTELYDKYGIPDGERVERPKDLVFIVPEKGYDVSRCCQSFGVDPVEVCVTWPKGELPFHEEAAALEAKFVFQIGCNLTRKFPALAEGALPGPRTQAKVLPLLPDRFVNLHHHDEYSIRDGLGKMEDLADLLERQRRSFCAVANHGSVGGWMRQYSVCKKRGLKAIFGAELYTSEERGEGSERSRSANHLLLMAHTEEGFYNIIRIHNDAQLNGFYFTPRANRQAFREWGRGIIGASACQGGEISRLLADDREDDAVEVYEFYKEHLDDFYLELVMVESLEQLEANRRIIQLAQRVGAKLLISVDSHYLVPEHFATHNLLMLIREGKTVADAYDTPEKVWQFEIPNLYYRNYDQLRSLWEDGFVARDAEGNEQAVAYKDDLFTEDVFEAAVANTREVALQCEPIKLDSDFRLPKLYPNSAQILVDKARAGFREKNLKGQRYCERLMFELNVINELGWADYFLIMQRIIEDTVARHGELAVGWGRGSAAGSLVSYCLGLTHLDPIEYGLLFERFLDYSRKDDCPDIDTDFDPRIRDDVKRRIVEMFGQEHTCSIGSYQTFKTRAVVIDVARSLALDFHEVNEVTKEMDPLAKFDVDTGDGTEEQQIDQMTLDEVCQHYPKMGDYFEKYPQVRQHAEVLRGQVKNMSTHAGGIIISDLDLRGRIPVLQDRKGSSVISAWAEGLATHELSEVGLVKFDILGLSNLAVIADCVKFIEETRGTKLTRATIDINNREAIAYGSKEDLVGIFQLDAEYTKPIIDAVKMESISDISALTSLIRPGPKNMGMHEEYARRKHGAPYDMPEFMRKALAGTYGIICYQEQCCVGETMVLRKDGWHRLDSTVEQVEGGASVMVLSVNDDGDVVERCVTDAACTGEKTAYRLEFDNGYFLECTEDHKVLTRRGWVQAQHLLPDDDVVTIDDMEH